MSLSARVGALRARAEVPMIDTFMAYAFEWGEVDGLQKQVPTPKGSTQGMIAERSQQDTNTRTVTVGGVERYVVDGGLRIPISAPLPAIGWEYVCTAVGAASDPSLLNRRWRVVDVPAKTYATVRRLDVVEVPEEV